jgi:hypothetical protein
MRRRLIIGGAVLVAVGTSAVKMSPNEVQQVEQHTGQKVEDLSEEQLDTAMDDLGIEGQEPSDQEIAMLEADDQNAQPAQSSQSVGQTSQPGSQTDLISQLERLGTLKAQGVVTEEEFTAAKAKLLAG